jgi:hypothetical protein
MEVKKPKTPKYVREFVLSQCLGCTVKIEQIAREYTKSQLGPMPGFAERSFHDYAKASISHYKLIRKAVWDLVQSEQVTIPNEGFVRSVD